MEKISKPESAVSERSQLQQRSVRGNAAYDTATIGTAPLAGNQAVQWLFRSGVIQAKLSVSSPTDPDEREADRVAERVMSSITPAHGKCDTCASGSPCSTCTADERIQAQHEPAEDGTVSLMIDRQRVTGTFTTRPSFIGVAPNDVSLASAAARLRSEGHRFNRLDLGVDAMSTEDIAELARRLVEELGTDMRTAAAAVTP